MFRYWKHFGAGLQKRQPNFKMWRHVWIADIARRKIPDHTLPLDMLPPGSRLMEAEDLLEGHIDDMPAQLLEKKHANKLVYDHPWPYNVQLDPVNSQEQFHCYNWESRFYTPRDDCQVLTNTIIETDLLEAHPPLEPSAEHIDYIKRQYQWATKDDSVLVRLPLDRAPQWPKMNIRPRASYGLTKDRIETNIMNTMASYAQTVLAKYYHEQADREKLDEILTNRSLAYPHCSVPFERDNNRKIHMDLLIDSIMIGKKSLPLINAQPDDTRQREPIDIKPRTWRSLLPQSKNYSPSWSFTLPQHANLHTIQISSRIKRKHRDADEMLARSMVHAFGLASQYARLQAVYKDSIDSGSIDNHASNVLQDPLSIRQVNHKDLLDQPVVLQTIGYDHILGSFLFMRYQLNTLNFDDNNPARIKNQAWHSGPISDLEQAFRYYLDFLTFDSSMVTRMISDLERERARPVKVAETKSTSITPELLSEGY